MTLRRCVRPRSSLQHAHRGSITVLAAIVLYVVVLLGVVAWAGIQEGADHAIVSQLLGNAAYDASHRTVDGEMVAGVPALACLTSPCTSKTCPTVLARDPAGTTADGTACRALRQGLQHVYTGAHSRLDVPATLAATRVWVLAPGNRDPEDATRVYHYPTVCLSTDATIGVLAYDGIAFRHHIHACGQAVYR